MRRLIEFWGGPLAVALLAAYALVRFLQADAGSAPASAGFCWITYANTALAGSAAMYATHLWLRAESVGRAATALAAGGSLGIVVGILIGALQGESQGIGLYEGTALFSAAAVFAYLGMERVYRNRAAGIIVMPAVLLAVLCEMWLIVQGLASPGRPADGLTAYWGAGHRFAVGLAYCPLAAAGILAALSLSQRGKLAAQMHVGTLAAALSLGVPLLLLGTAMGAIWSLTDLRGSSRAVGYLAASGVAALLALAAWVHILRPGNPHFARWAGGAFIASTASLLASSWAGEALR